jgi:hypothetical protein
MSTAPDSPAGALETTPLPSADGADLAEQALEIDPEAPTTTEPAACADEGDALEQAQEIGWGEERDGTD